MTTTTTLEIHPAIGIARMGSSQEFFLGPEPGLPIETNRRDATADQLLKRQAARFRVYSCIRDELGALLSFEELTPDKAAITWSVHLVNRKAAAPCFLKNNLPNTDSTFRRNGATGDDTIDADLIIDGGTRTLTGALQPKATFQGTFKGDVVPLGEMSTDADGRLVVVGGFGQSRSFPPGLEVDDFADNDKWHDDTSDGPVEATVHFLDGSPDKAVDKPAWVIACQPDFAPGIGNLVTLYDAFVDQAIYERNVLPAPTFRPAYDRDVLPLLNRAAAYRWVNSYARVAHGPGGKGDFASFPSLGDPNQSSPQRKRFVRLLRDPAGAATPFGTPAMPALFSDDYFSDTKLVLPLTRAQYRILSEWSKGQFDTTGPAPAEGEPDALTRVALEACAGGAFCPGIEAGRRIRDATIYAAGEVFRFDRSKLRAGELTQSMALPWQADFALCRWEGQGPPVSHVGRGWWPAQRPDHVLKKPDDADMVSWDRKADTMALMTDHWHELGILLETIDGAGKQAFAEVQRTLPE